MKAALGSTGGGRPNFVTTQWGLIISASAENTTEAQRLSRRFIVPIATRFTRLFGDVATRGKTRKILRKIFLPSGGERHVGPGDQQRGRFRSFCWER